MGRQTGRQFYKLVVTAWLAFTLGSVVFALISWAQLSTDMAAGRRITETRDTLHGILESLLDLETGERGYVITGDKQFLEPFNEAETNLPPQFSRLAALAHDNPKLLDKVTDLSGSATTISAFEDQVIAAREKRYDKAATMVSAGQLKGMMDSIRGQIAQLDGICRSQQTAIRREVYRRVTRANLTTLVAGIFGLGAGSLALWLSYVAIRHHERETELMEAKLQAEHNSQEKTLFLANVSHEIRTPMNAILGFSELLQNQLREPKQRQYLQSIRSSATSLLQIINDILDASKIESGIMELHPEPTDLREICDFIQTMFLAPAAKKNVKLLCRVGTDFPHAILMDRIRLRQILVNLVGNAVKFTERGSIYVNVLWEKEPESSRITLIIEVEDTGVGIPRDKLDAIFKPFIQAGAHRDKEKSGTGLGLAIVKRLAEMLGGTVTVASVPGQGSAFHLRFPHIPISARLSASQKHLPATETDFNELRPATLLVVDDNETNCDLIAGMFADSHHKLVFTSNGQDAIAKARELRPDIILMDVRMPGMSGYEVLSAIQKFIGLEMVPAIAITASALLDEEDVVREKFSGYVRKPFSKRELFDELAEFLPRHEVEAAPKTDETEDELFTRAPKELLTQLRQLLVESWPAIRDSVAVNESKTFAQNLERLGQQFQCRPLKDYAQKLSRDAENYAVTDLEKHLGEFSALVEQLDRDTQK
jgi:signal transduction histidine kinase/CheY-like chemotaxis protein